MIYRELLKLIKQGENQAISLKSLKAKPSVLARSMVSFSNTNDGLLIIGIDDKTRKICGAKATKQKEEILDNIHKATKQSCQPNVDIPKIEEIKTPNGTVFVVSIAKDPDEVYVTEGAVLVRKGTVDIKPSNYDIQLLFSKRNKLRFEEEIVEGATITPSLPRISISSEINKGIPMLPGYSPAMAMLNRSAKGYSYLKENAITTLSNLNTQSIENGLILL